MSNTGGTGVPEAPKCRGKPGPKPGASRAFRPHDTITEGAAIGVLLSNRTERVWLDRADYDRIVAAYGTRGWVWVSTARYVRLRPSPCEDVPVARLVLESDGSGFVRYSDGDRLNLRRENLSIQAQRERGCVLKRPGVRAVGRQFAVTSKHVSDTKGEARQFPASASFVPTVSGAPAMRIVVPTVKRRTLTR